ncbi:RdgB/HAM1 family non-canonical purine NTP pyrophosphatase [Opitutales bacterium ASA1]|uniref:RdgB/HAM1 family non-canonical purine NTP pyrophosphatase n=1 Tax=Congregicoccus parvus TaxID=3081749 RepID=UPI002B2967AB|nr:RdgB/HAM1 family non-canonical purine NTP pyrophosphatase [Opitutales bacterium ASA1]
MKLYLATGNAHKLGELSTILAASDVSAEVIPPSAVGGMPHVDEDADTFEGNALKKAHALAERVRERGAPDGSWAALADDSGLCVDALGGAPGVHSAYYAGRDATDTANTAKLLAALAGTPDSGRTAAFRCVIAVVREDGTQFTFEGRCPGRIVSTPSGGGGFGYDPVFVPEDHDRTFAELPAETKHAISHRGRALARFTAWLRSVS